MHRLLIHESPSVRCAAALGVGDLCSAFGDAMLVHMQRAHQTPPTLLLSMLTVACSNTKPASAAAEASLG